MNPDQNPSGKDLPARDPAGYREELIRQLEEFRQGQIETADERKKRKQRESSRKYAQSEKGKARRAKYDERIGKAKKKGKDITKKGDGKRRIKNIMREEERKRRR